MATTGLTPSDDGRRVAVALGLMMSLYDLEPEKSGLVARNCSRRGPDEVIVTVGTRKGWNSNGGG
eukprot:635213-Pyramimonas_sp.AAC.1